MATPEQTEVKGGPTTSALIANSLLEGPIQALLLGEITEKARTVLDYSPQIPTFYVAFSTQNYVGAINGRFVFGIQRKQLERPSWDIYGPFDRKLGCTFAYLKQEARVLVGSVGSEQLDKELDRLGVFSANALGQGLARFANQFGVLRSTQPSLAADKIIQAVVAGQCLDLEAEVKACKQRYLDAHAERGVDEVSAAYQAFRMAQDRLEGIDHGALLARELIVHPWTQQS